MVHCGKILVCNGNFIAIGKTVLIVLHEDITPFGSAQFHQLFPIADQITCFPLGHPHHHSVAGSLKLDHPCV